MAARSTPPRNCLCGGCDAIGQCTRCGFDRAENERRKKLPLVNIDGLRRKIIPRNDPLGREPEGNNQTIHKDCEGRE